MIGNQDITTLIPRYFPRTQSKTRHFLSLWGVMLLFFRPTVSTARETVRSWMALQDTLSSFHTLSRHQRNERPVNMRRSKRSLVEEWGRVIARVAPTLISLQIKGRITAVSEATSTVMLRSFLFHCFRRLFVADSFFSNRFSRIWNYHLKWYLKAISH